MRTNIFKTFNLIHVFLFVVLLGNIGLPANVGAQENQTSQSSQANASATKHKPSKVSALIVEHDRFKNETNLGVNATLSNRFDNSGFVPVVETVQMLIGGSYAGTTPKVPQTVIIFLTASTRSPLFSEKAEMIALVDGQPLNFGTAFDYAATKQNKLFGSFGGYRESIRYMDVPFEKFAKFAQAKKVEIRVGRTEYVLDPEVLEGYRQILTHVNYSEPKSSLNKQQNSTEKPKRSSNTNIRRKGN